MVGARAREMYDRQAKGRQTATLKKGQQKPVPANLPGRDSGDARDQIGKAIGVGDGRAEEVMPRTRPSELELTAYHEAGHAAVAFHLGRGVPSVTIVPDPAAGTLGVCRYRRIWKGNAFLDVNPPRRSEVEREILIGFAGGIAEAVRKGRYNHVGRSSDLSAAIGLAELVSSSMAAAEKYLGWLHQWAEDLVTTPSIWHTIRRLAAALLESPKLNGKVAKQVYHDAKFDHDGCMTAAKELKRLCRRGARAKKSPAADPAP